MSEREHWETVHGRQSPEQASWYAPHLDRSLSLIEQAGLAKDASIVDVGGGASTLVDDLLAHGYSNLTVLDISSLAIESARERLGSRGDIVSWVTADITRVALPKHSLDFWHDRAVFHFLVEQKARHRYVDAVRHALKPGGYIVVATFGPSGPERCSGLDVVRYGPDELHAEFGAPFQKISSSTELHQTPWGSEQEFVYCYCRVAG
jgi:SAM-dependent methyltransferase